MHVLVTLTQELKSLNVEQILTVTDITLRIVDLDKALVSLQITVDNKHTNIVDKSSGKDDTTQLQEQTKMF